MTEVLQSKYRWYVTVLGFITHVLTMAVPLYSMPVLFKEISEDLHLDLVQLGVVWGLASLPVMFGAFAAGLVSDKFGSMRTLGISCFLTAAAGAARGISGDFATLAITTFLFGLFSIPLAITTHKAVGEWFGGRQEGVAHGVLAAGFGFGDMFAILTSATVFSPLLGNWRNLMFAFGAVTVVVGILWLTARPAPSSTSSPHPGESVPSRQAFLHVIRLKDVWLLGLFQLGIYAYFMGLIGYLPLFLRSAGWTPASADTAIAAFGAASLVGVLPLSLLSDRIGLRKPLLYAGLAMAIVGIGLITVFGGTVVWILWIAVIMAGLFQELFFGLSITMIIETKGVGPAYAGSALGLVTMLAGLGAFVSPPAGNSLAEIQPQLGLAFWLLLAVASLVSVAFLTETGWKKNSVAQE